MLKKKYKGGVYSTRIKGYDYVLALVEPDKAERIRGLLVHEKNDTNLVEVDDVFVDCSSPVVLHVDELSEQLKMIDDSRVNELFRTALLEGVSEYYTIAHKPLFDKKFEPDKSRINYAGRVYEASELVNLVDSALEFYLTAGRYDRQFCSDFEKLLTSKSVSTLKVITVNSGSSANLLAMTALTSPKLGDKRLLPGDEVITVAAGFPTSIAPIVQNGLIPVFVDIEQESLNIDSSQIEEAVTNRTKAIFLAHTLGIPFNLDKVLELAEKYELWVIEDNCDCLGASYTLSREYKLLNNKIISGTAYTGTIGHIGTSSFYPAHQITMGEGGAVYTSDLDLYRIALSLRDWGRDCWCEPGKDNTCSHRFEMQLGLLPRGYDHKYTYSHIGYNLKITDMQAAIGVAQLPKLTGFAQKRYKNWCQLKEQLNDLSDFFYLPSHPVEAIPSPFGFSLTLKENLKFGRDDLTQYLESNHIQTRNVFAGNMLRQPAFVESRLPVRISSGAVIHSCEVTDEALAALPITDTVMERTFWIGVYPGLKVEMIDYMSDKIKRFVKKFV